MTKKTLMRRQGYVAADTERICLAFIEHPDCGAYLCNLRKGHQHGNDPRLQKHQAACRRHHCHLVIWEEEPLKISNLTVAQHRLMIEVLNRPGIVIDGRRMTAAYALEKLGLVATKTSIIDSYDGGRWQVAITPTAAAKGARWEKGKNHRGRQRETAHPKP